MPIKNLMRQDPSIAEVKSEGDLVALLEEVRRDLHIRDAPVRFDEVSLLKILEYVEQGKYEPPTENNEIDLSKAQRLVQSYKFLSEGGCISCRHRVAFHSGPSEVDDYCGKYEKAEDASNKDFGRSPRIRQYQEKGCDERASIFRPLSEVLKSKKQCATTP